MKSAQWCKHKFRSIWPVLNEPWRCNAYDPYFELCDKDVIDKLMKEWIAYERPGHIPSKSACDDRGLLLMSHIKRWDIFQNKQTKYNVCFGWAFVNVFMGHKQSHIINICITDDEKVWLVDALMGAWMKPDPKEFNVRQLFIM